MKYISTLLTVLVCIVASAQMMPARKELHLTTKERDMFDVGFSSGVQHGARLIKLGMEKGEKELHSAITNQLKEGWIIFTNEVFSNGIVVIVETNK